MGSVTCRPPQSPSGRLPQIEATSMRTPHAQGQHSCECSAANQRGMVGAGLMSYKDQMDAVLGTVVRCTPILPPGRGTGMGRVRCNPAMRIASYIAERNASRCKMKGLHRPGTSSYRVYLLFFNMLGRFFELAHGLRLMELPSEAVGRKTKQNTGSLGRRVDGCVMQSSDCETALSARSPVTVQVASSTLRHFPISAEPAGCGATWKTSSDRMARVQGAQYRVA